LVCNVRKMHPAETFIRNNLWEDAENEGTELIEKYEFSKHQFFNVKLFLFLFCELNSF
jgi:hypothetical protein